MMPGNVGDDGNFQPLTDKAMGRAVRRLFGLKKADGTPLLDIPKFSPHDLRRTMRTHLAALRVAPHVAEKCLNHSLGRIIQIYDTGDYFDERKEALERWAQKVDLAVSPRINVSQLRTA